MKTKIILIFFVILTACQKKDVVPDMTNFTGAKNRYKLKTEFGYSNPNDTVPNSFHEYTYDKNWNLLKILHSEYPKPLLASETHEYSNDNKLINKKYFSFSGVLHPDIKESDLHLAYECKYEYTGNKQIEKYFSDDILKYTTTYTYKNELILEELRYDHESSDIRHIYYQYDSKKNLTNILVTLLSVGIFSNTNYIYRDTLLYQELINYVFDARSVVNTYKYSNIDNKKVVDVYTKEDEQPEYLSEKTTYMNGKKIEDICYNNKECICRRFEYY
jgi:hypothetical protein